MSVYGDTLLSWTEQQRLVVLYDMTALPNSGYRKVEGSDIKVIAVIQHGTGGRLQDGNGNLVRAEALTMWTRTAGLLGKYLDFQDTTYRIVSEDDWTYEGGFMRYDLQKLTGDSDGKADGTDITWNTGTGSFR